MGRVMVMVIIMGTKVAHNRVVAVEQQGRKVVGILIIPASAEHFMVNEKKS